MDEKMKKIVRSIQLEMLDEINRICREENINYSLAYGTLLGAVRHKGYIPWDDDVDIMMTRDDYDKFLDVSNEINSKFFLQTYNTDHNYHNLYAKLVANDTIYTSKNNEKNMHNGVFIDIFPIDYLSKNELVNNVIKNINYFLLITIYENYKRNNKIRVNISKKILLRIISKIPCWKILMFLEKLNKLISNKDSLRVCNYDDIYQSSQYAFSSSYFKLYINLEFEGKQYKSISEYDNYLRFNYGNYLKLPPEDDRKSPHSVELVDVSKYKFK